MRHKVGTHISAPRIQYPPDFEGPVSMRPPAWTEQARCIGYDPEIFYRVDSFWVAKRICRVCPVRLECLASAPDNYYGVFGGRTPGERKSAQRP